jgi:hypothetical protein
MNGPLMAMSWAATVVTAASMVTMVASWGGRAAGDESAGADVWLDFTGRSAMVRRYRFLRRASASGWHALRLEERPTCALTSA